MRIKIYQINFERDKNRVAFESLARLERLGFPFDSSIYDCVYSGEVNARGLEDVFYIFNMDRPEDFRGHSLSVSDVVEIDGAFFFCDSFGWERVEF